MKTLMIMTGIYAMAFCMSCSPKSKSIPWLTSYDQAVEMAARENKPVLVFFHGSDWCPPCIRMQREVFTNDTFIHEVSEKAIFLDIDFPRKKKITDAQLSHNNDVKKKFGLPEDFTQGYPQVVIINAEGNVFYQEKGYSGEGPDELINLLDSIKNHN